jgi:hypothetical protein
LQEIAFDPFQGSDNIDLQDIVFEGDESTYLGGIYSPYQPQIVEILPEVEDQVMAESKKEEEGLFIIETKVTDPILQQYSLTQNYKLHAHPELAHSQTSPN